MAIIDEIEAIRNGAGGGGMTKNEDVSWIPKPVRCSLKEYSTAKLVTELSKRDGVEITVASARDYYEVCINRKDSDYPEPPMDYGPAKILVVRE